MTQSLFPREWLCLLLTLLASLPLFAATGDKVTDLAQLDNAKTYTLKVGRGYLPATLSSQCVSTASGAGHYALLASDSIRNGYYIYNVEKGKFISAGSVSSTTAEANLYLDAPDGVFLLSAAPTAGSFIIASEMTGNYMQVGGANQFVLNTGWKQPDAGNQWTITEAGTFDATAAVAAVQDAEKTLFLPEEVQDGVVFVYDGTSKHNVVYRIPSIASIPAGKHKNRVVAFTDYRPGGADVGIAEVDLHCKYSDDFGKTWSREITIVDGLGGSAFKTHPDDPSFKEDFSYGDPVSISDRETGELLVVSCSGNVSYQASNNTHHQHMVQFRSTDGGATWTAPEDVNYMIKSQLDQRTVVGKTYGWFVGSGGFTQSRFVKKGSHYRVYGAILERNETVSNAYGMGYVIYTDDFGKTWNILGGGDVYAIYSGGNEAKAEELPDGSVLISIRKGGGRYFNIWYWDDETHTTGHWGQCAATTNMTAADCNGEILIVPAQRKRDGASVYLAMQSVPMSGSRQNVGIYYKELPSVKSYSTPALFAANWTAGLQVSTKGSAYSAMVLQEDHHIGFLVEEDSYGKSYSQRYANLSVDEITKGAYTFLPHDEVDQTSFQVKRGSVSYNLYWDGTLRETVSASGYYGDPMPRPTMPSFLEAEGMPEGVISEEVVGKTFDVNLSWSSTAPVKISPDTKNLTYYFLKIKNANYIIDSGTAPLTVTSTTHKTGDVNCMWAFVGNPFDGFQLYCANGRVMASANPQGDGNTGGSTYPHTVAPDAVPANESALWTLEASSYYTNGFLIYNKEWGTAMNHRNPNLAYWTGGADGGSTFTAALVPAAQLPVGIEHVQADAAPNGKTLSEGDAEIYDLSGRRCTPSVLGLQPARSGIYIIDRKKVVL